MHRTRRELAERTPNQRHNCGQSAPYLLRSDRCECTRHGDLRRLVLLWIANGQRRMCFELHLRRRRQGVPAGLSPAYGYPMTLPRMRLLHRLLLVFGFEPVMPTRLTARPAEAAQSARADPELLPLSRS